MNDEENIYGLVLAGGRSSRMGSDKGLISYHGMPQREYLFQLMGRFCSKVYTSSHSGQPVPSELNPLPDRFSVQGPLNGILTAFSSHPAKAWLIIAVDMPFVNEQVIGHLLTHRNKTKIATCFYNDVEKFPEPLMALWEPAAFPLLHTFIREGGNSPKAFLNENDVHLVIPENNQTLININSPEEYKNYLKPD